MKKVSVILFVLILVSCSRGEEYEKKRSPREDNVLIKAIRTPLNQASDAKNTADNRTDSIDQGYKELEEFDENNDKDELLE